MSEEYDNEREDETSGGGGGFLGLLSILFIPAAIVALLTYLLLRVGKMRFTVIASIVALVEFVTLGLWVKLGASSKLFEFIDNITNIKESWKLLATPYLLINIFLGSLAGLFIVAWEIRQMKANPHRLELPGSWVYKFEYRRTPLEILKKKKIIDSLKRGSLGDSNKAPLGLVEKGDYRPAFRYYDEASKHTLITGNSGSGKPLHGDTEVPTTKGFVKLKDIKPGDTVFDEKGNKTLVKSVHHPYVQQAYRMTLRNGQEIITASEHLWKVYDYSIRNSHCGINPTILNKLNQDIEDCDGTERITKKKLKKIYPSLKQFIVRNNFPAESYNQLSVDGIIETLQKNERGEYETLYIEELSNFLYSYPYKTIIQKVLVDHFPHRSLSSLTRYNLYKKGDGYSKIEVLDVLRTQVEKYLNDSSFEKTLSTQEIFEGISEGKKYVIPHVEDSVSFTDEVFPIEPYTFGAWLGNGYSKINSICGEDFEIIEETRKYNEILVKESKPGFFDWKILSFTIEDLRDLGVYGNKHIPEVYKFSSSDTRKRLIAGIIDTEGSVSPNGMVTICLDSKRLVDDIFSVVSSLGWKASSIKVKKSRVSDFNGKEYISKEQYMFTFIPKDLPLQVSRKKERLNNERGFDRFSHKIVSLTPVKTEHEKFYCITVSAESHLFLVTRSYIPTRNTITMQNLILNDIRQGIPTVIIDLKRSPEFASKLAKWAKDEGSQFYHFVNGAKNEYDIPHSPGQSFYDPLKSGSPTSKADMVLGMREYDTASAVYKASMQQLLQVLFAMLKVADKSKAPNIDWDSGGIYQIASAVKEGNLQDLAAACEGTEIQEAAEEIYHESQGKTQIRHAIDELRGQMRTITSSEYGAWLKTNPAERSIDLFQQTQSRGSVILFSLNSDSEPEFARYVGSMIMADLTATSAKRRNKQASNQVNVYIDEFQAINPSSVASLLEKSRESKMAMTLGQQSFEQIIASTQNNGEAYLLSIMDTCSNFIVHAGATEDSALRLSKILGKEWVDVYKASNKNKNFFLNLNWKNKRTQTISTSREEHWKFSPSKFMRLSSPDKNNGFKSTAVIVNKTSSDPEFKNSSGAVAREVWMIPDDLVLEKYYDPNNATYDEPMTRLEPVILVTERTLFDEDDSFEEVKPPGKSRAIEPTLQDEEDDGDFSFEPIDDDEVGTFDLDSYVTSSDEEHFNESKDDEDFINDEPDELVEKEYLTKRKLDDTSSMNKFYEEKKVNKEQSNQTLKVVSAQPPRENPVSGSQTAFKPKSGGLPIPTSSGLPIPKSLPKKEPASDNSSKKDFKSNDSGALPSLDELM